MTTASLVLYKTPKSQIEALLSSVLPSCAGKLIIVDNSPDDRWRELEGRSGKIRYIHNENLGYGGSHNLAMRLAIEMGTDKRPFSHYNHFPNSFLKEQILECSR